MRGGEGLGDLYRLLVSYHVKTTKNKIRNHPCRHALCLVVFFVHLERKLRATSHTRLRARDRYNSSTLIGGKGGAGPSSLLHTTLEGPAEYVDARWM